MRIFDPHIHMTSRTTDDYAALYASGVRALVEPAFWMGQPRTSVGSFIDYFDSLLGWERFRASQFGIRHHATIALNPKEANDPRCVPVLEEIPRYLSKEGVVAVGEIGFDSMTPAEDEAFIRQLEMAYEFSLPALVHTPHREKLQGTRRTLDIIRESQLAPSMVVVDHLNEANVGMVKDAGAWMGFSIYPDTKMDERRLVAILHEYGTDQVLVNSAADWGKSDPLKTASTAKAMLAGGFSADDVDRVLWQNPVDFYAQSGQLILDPIAGFDGAELGGAGATFEGNSLLRGARA